MEAQNKSRQLDGETCARSVKDTLEGTIMKKKKKLTNECLSCLKPTTNKQFCSGECRKKFNNWSKDCGHGRSEYLSSRGRRA